MANNDGSIRIKAVINDEKAKKQLDQLESKMRRQTEQVNKQTAAVRRLEEQFQQLASGEKEPQSVKRMAADLKKAEEEAAKLDEQFQKLNAIASVDRQARGQVEPETEAKLAALSEQMAQADARADLLKRRLADIQMDPNASEEAKKLASDLSLASDKLTRMKLEADSTQQSINELSRGASGRFGQVSAVLGTIGQKIRSGFVGAVNLAGKALERVRGGIRKLGKEKGFDKAGKAAHRFGNRLRRIVTGALFFNIISRGLTALTRQISTYLTANREFSNALADVKSNLLTAFQPIYDTIIPAMTKLMQHMERFTAILAKISAAAFGTTAKKAQENAAALKEQADATKDAGKEAKKAEKYLASFDTIEKIGKDEEEKKTEPEFDTNFEDVQIPSWLKDFWQPFKDSWEELGKSTVQSVKDALGAIWGMLKSIAGTFLDIWKSGTGLEFLNLLQLALQTILGIIGDIARAFTEAWNSGAGEAVINALFFMLNSILRLIISIGEAFRTAWNDGSGVQIMTTLLNILANIMNTVGELATRLREAWEANENGVAIWNVILDIVQDVLDFFEEITTATLAWAQELDLTPIVTAFREFLAVVEPLVDTLLGGLSWAWENILLPLAKWTIEEAAPAAINLLSSAFKALAPIVQTVGQLLQALWGIVQPFASFFGSVLIAALDALGAAIEAVGNIISWIIGKIADAANAVSEFLNRIGAGFRTVVLNDLGISKSGRNATYSTAELSSVYPHLANGATIPANHEFLAVLGDQRSGTNIEAPLDTIKQAVRDVFGESGIGSGSTNVNVEFNGSLAALGRVLVPVIRTEEQRRGPTIGGDLA